MSFTVLITYSASLFVFSLSIEALSKASPFFAILFMRSIIYLSSVLLELIGETVLKRCGRAEVVFCFSLLSSWSRIAVLPKLGAMLPCADDFLVILDTTLTRFTLSAIGADSWAIDYDSSMIYK